MTPRNSVSTRMPMAALMMSRLSVISSVQVGSEALNDWAKEEGWEESERADEHDHADQQDHERRVVGSHRAETGGADPLAGQRDGDSEREQDRREPREQH